MNQTLLRSYLTFLLSVFYLLNYFLSSEILHGVLVLLMLMVLSLGLSQVTGSSKVIGLVSFGISISLLLGAQAPLAVWVRGLEQNLYLVVLFSLVPLLRIPIQHGGYFEALQDFFRRYVFTKNRFYLLVSFLSAFVGVLVNLAIVPLVYEISRASEYSRHKRLLSAALSRGFTTTTIWSPTMASIALIIQVTGATWHGFIPLALLNGLIAGAVGYLVTRWEEKDWNQAADTSLHQLEVQVATSQSTTEETVAGSRPGKVVELSLFAVALILIILLVSQASGIRTVEVVSMAALIFPVLWLGIIGRYPLFVRALREEYFPINLPNIKNEIFLFAGAGFFATSVTQSSFSKVVPDMLMAVVGTNILLLTFLVIGITLLLAALGVHPIVSVTIFGSLIQPADFGITPLYLALVLAVSWSIGISISPSAANVIAVAGLVGESPLQIGPRWNAKYALAATVVLMGMLTLYRLVGLA